VSCVLEFAIPREAPVSDLDAGRPVYWELALCVDGFRRRLRSRFFVPVAGARVRS
jgi:hypothetical protein